MKTPTEIQAHHVTNERQFNWYNVFMVVAMSLGTLAYGYSTAIIGPTLGTLPNPSTLYLSDTESSSTINTTI